MGTNFKGHVWKRYQKITYFGLRSGFGKPSPTPTTKIAKSSTPPAPYPTWAEARAVERNGLVHLKSNTFYSFSLFSSIAINPFLCDTATSVTCDCLQCNVYIYKLLLNTWPPWLSKDRFSGWKTITIQESCPFCYIQNLRIRSHNAMLALKLRSDFYRTLRW